MSPPLRIRRWRARALGLGLGLVLAAGAGADYRRSYVDALMALRQGDLATAVARLEEALRGRPREAARARLVGAIPEPYLPHHYLGRAFYRLGNCARAEEHWRLSAEQGAVAGERALLAEIAPWRERCAAQLAASRAAAPAPGPAVEPAAATPAPAPIRPTTEPPGASEESPTAGAEPVPASSPAGSPAVGEPAPGETAPGPAPNPPVEETPPPTPATPAPREQPSEALVAALQAFFEGDPGLCLARLQALEPASGRERFFRLLFRSAARYSLYLLDGERDAEALAQAIADLVAARRLDPRWAPHPDVFSPRFLAFFREHPP